MVVRGVYVVVMVIVVVVECVRGGGGGVIFTLALKLVCVSVRGW